MSYLLSFSPLLFLQETLSNGTDTHQWIAAEDQLLRVAESGVFGQISLQVPELRVEGGGRVGGDPGGDEDDSGALELTSTWQLLDKQASQLQVGEDHAQPKQQARRCKYNFNTAETCYLGNCMIAYR